MGSISQQFRKRISYKTACAPSEDSDQPANPVQSSLAAWAQMQYCKNAVSRRAAVITED